MNVKKIREDFPLLLANPDLTYLDSAATSQKPACVLRAEREFYECHNANPLRGLYELSENATKCYEDARKTVQHFIGAARPEEIIFTRNATESLNLVAYSLGSPGRGFFSVPGLYCRRGQKNPVCRGSGSWN